MRRADVARPGRCASSHCPVNVAGIPWANVQALRRKGVDARLVVFNRGRSTPKPTGRSTARRASRAASSSQWRALARLLPRTDVFHFYFGLTLVPKSLQFPILRARGARVVFHYLGSDIRGKPPERARLRQARADAEIVGSYDAIRWVPEAHVDPAGLDLRAVSRRAAVRPRAARSSSTRRRAAAQGNRARVDACEQLAGRPRHRRGPPHDEARERYARADIVVDQLNAGWHGVFALEAMALGKPVVTHLNADVVEPHRGGFGVRVPLVPATKETLARRAAPARRGRRRCAASIGAASRAYVEQVHDIDRIADRLLDLYARL